MKKKVKTTLKNGKEEYAPIDLLKKLNLNHLSYTNKTICAGLYDLPALVCNTKVLPDYIALYTQPGLYHNTALTAVGFWLYDETFEDYDGLYNAIHYKVKHRLKFYKERFEGVKIFFTPDYSQSGDMDLIEQLTRLKMARVVGLWLVEELGAVVIPFITAALPNVIDVVLDGLEACSVVAFSTKGYVGNQIERQVLKELVRLTVDKLPNLQTIVVYDTCKDNSAINDIFAYALKHGIKVVIPANTLKDCNIRHAQERSKLPASTKQTASMKGGDD